MHLQRHSKMRSDTTVIETFYIKPKHNIDKPVFIELYAMTKVPVKCNNFALRDFKVNKAYSYSRFGLELACYGG